MKFITKFKIEQNHMKLIKNLIEHIINKYIFSDDVLFIILIYQKIYIYTIFLIN